MCPAGDEVDPEHISLRDLCGDDLEVERVKKGPGQLEMLPRGDAGAREPWCCYTVEVVDHDSGAECVVGRPFHEEGVAVRAPLVNVDAVVGNAGSNRRARAWANAGAAEHASVAAFSRLALQLMALGAPNELVRDAHRAALDELGHAELCWSVARDLGEAGVVAGVFPFGSALPLDVSLAELAAETVRDGCLAETLGAHLAAVIASHTAEPFLRDALARIAEDEARHAVLSFRVVAWALERGGQAVRAAVCAAFDQPSVRLDLHELSLRTGIDLASLRQAAEQGLRDVVVPARGCLLAA
jgi:hypothetical protein